MADDEVGQMRSEVAQLREMVQTLAQAVAMSVSSFGGNGDEGGGDSGDEEDSWQDVVPTIGGGGSHMGNTDDSEEIDGDVTFESADDSNVEVTTEKRTEGDEEVNVIKIGVYYI